ncbi:hypothetical protein KAR91_78185 [Candidatus Pacearchaeota archaeon]|nr:hypothetical protein [Candidatus Pacearchaeota archaeon]
MRQTIIFIPGIFNPKSNQKLWRNEAKKQGFNFIEFKRPLYSYWSIKRMQEMKKQGVQIFKRYQNKKPIVICHSFGGILVNSILSEFKNYKMKKLIIMASPLNMDIFGMKRRKMALNYNKNLKYKTKIISYGGYIDTVVPFGWTKYHNEEHINLLAGHLYFLFSKKFIKKTLKSLK